MGWTEERMFGNTVEEHINHVYYDMDFVTDGVVKNGDEYYRAFRDKEGKVHALIIFFKRKNNEICWKSFTDSCGVFTYNCPAFILDKLTPTDNEWANEWRKLCRERIKRNKMLIEGLRIKMDDRLMFTIKGEKSWKDTVILCDTFEIVKVKNGKVNSLMLRALPEDYEPFICRVKHWKERNFKIII